MARRLADVTTSPLLNPFDNAGRVPLVRAKLASTFDDSARRRLTAYLAAELLNAGEPEAARAAIQSLLRGVDLAAGAADPAVAGLIRGVRELSALCDLRIGERDNCVHNHGAESCLMPIRGTGVHQDQRGSRAAMKTYVELLAEQPSDLGARWLLNVAAQTVGDYPDRVPAGLLVPPEIFDSEHDVGRFHDVAPATGLDQRGLAGGVIVDDFDGDRLLDVVTSSFGNADPLRFYRNRGNGSFADESEAWGLGGLPGGLNVVQADYDNDGRLDVLVLRGAWLHTAGQRPNSLLRNRGDGTFEDVTEAAGLLTFHPTQVGAWGDYDGDGWLDLFIGNEADSTDPDHPSELWHNNRDGTFTNRIELLDAAPMGYVKGAAWGDFDNDGRQDLVVVGLGMQPRLFQNDGPTAGMAGGREWGFTEVAAGAGIVGPRRAFATWFWDYDNDGWLDLFIAPYKVVPLDEVVRLHLRMAHQNEVPRLYRNNRDGTFSDVTRSARLDRVALVMGTSFGDLDNDGWLDLYAGTGGPDLRMLIPNRMFRNAEGAFFQDVTTSGGFGHIQKGHGVAFADVDNDGDQDVYESMGGAYSADFSHNVLYENPGHGNRWITLRLEGRRSNRSAIGARIRVDVETSRGPRSIHAVVSSGGSFGASPLRAEIGLGDARRIRSIEVRWPAGGVSRVERPIAMDRAYELVEGDERPRTLALPKLVLGQSAG